MKRREEIEPITKAKVLATISLIGVVVTFLLGIWTGDHRWAISGAVLLIPTVVGGVGWLALKLASLD